jgi:hypothetical protein
MRMTAPLFRGVVMVRGVVMIDGYADAHPSRVLGGSCGMRGAASWGMTGSVMAGGQECGAIALRRPTSPFA